MGAVRVVSVRPLAQTGDHQQRRTSKEGEKDEKSGQHGEASILEIKAKVRR
jgi:hypothetical protein